MLVWLSDIERKTPRGTGETKSICVYIEYKNNNNSNKGRRQTNKQANKQTCKQPNKT